MITIIVGVPGAGKTLYAVSRLREEYKDRPVYHYNIPGLSIEEWKELENPEKWHELPTGSVTVVDEAHEVFPKRDYKVKEPEHIEAAATLRHRGHDLVLVTQHPVDLDIFLRRRCARFIYLKKPLSKAAYAQVYMWGEYVENYKDEREQQKAESFQFSYPADAFDSYKSAQLHTSKRYVPKAAKRATIIVVVALVVAGFALRHVLHKFVNPAADAVPVADSSVVEAAQPHHVNTALDYVQELVPRVADLPASAPMFDELNKAKTMPRPTCVASADRCQCYTQQATRLYISEPICRTMVTDGVFDHTKTEGRQGGV